MIEQIVLYIFIFISGILFSMRNSICRAMEAMLISGAEQMKSNLKNRALYTEARFEKCYYMIYKHLKDKNYSNIRNELEEIKLIFKEYLGV